MKKFLYQDPLQGDDWYEVTAYGPAHAAHTAAELVDDDSGGDLADGNTIHIKEGNDGEVHTFVISVDYEKTFTVYEKKKAVEHAQQDKAA